MCTQSDVIAYSCNMNGNSELSCFFFCNESFNYENLTAVCNGDFINISGLFIFSTAVILLIISLLL